MKISTGNKLLHWIILVSLGLVWGTSYILIKKGLHVLSSGELGALRISISFLVLLPFFYRQIRKIPRKHWPNVLLVGILGNGIPVFLFAKAQTGIDSHLAGIINSLSTLFTLVVGVLFFSYKTKWFNVSGVLAGLIGTFGLLTISGGKSLEFNFSYAVYIILATILSAVNVNIIKTYLSEIDPVALTTVSLCFVGLPIMVYLLGFTPFTMKLATNGQAWAAVAYVAFLAVFGTVIAGIVFTNLIQITSPVFASAVSYIIPMIAIQWGIFDGEKFNALDMTWFVLILGGVALVNLGKNQKART